MKLGTTLSLLVVATSLVSCNEKVSPELEGSNVTIPGGSGANSSDAFFNVTNTSAAMLNYKLHKTGAGNFSKPCEIKNTTGFTNDNFRGAPSVYDVSCFFEAEELSLYHQGMSFSINASPNTCDFVAYSPFSFYDYMPGDSSGTYTQVVCGNDTTSGAHVTAAAASDGVDLTSSTAGVRCNQLLSEDIDPAVRNKFFIENDNELCRFSYSNGPNCDIGEITVNEYKVTYTPPGDDPATQPAITKSEFATRKVKCGGDTTSCVKGAIEHVSRQGVSRVILVSQSTKDAPISLEYKLPAPIEKKYLSNKAYANFRRNLASLDIDFGTSFGNPIPAPYKSSFGDPIYGKVFNPMLMDYYSSNMKLDSTPIIDAAMVDSNSFVNNTYKAVPLAAEPFMGVSADTMMNEVYKVNPFYTFYCLDTAMDIKARIKMVVREWDRAFPSDSTDLEYITDIFRGTNSKQDNQFSREVAGDTDVLIPFNDFQDWDDRIQMTRTPLSFDPTLSIWRPVPTALATDGFFNKLNFTNGRY
jgi:hypothetical protein